MIFRQVIVGTARALVKQAKGCGTPVPCLLPQMLGLPDNCGDNRFGLGLNYAQFDADPALQRQGASIFSTYCANIIPPGYGGPILVDHEYVHPWPTNQTTKPLPASWWDAYVESTRGLAWLGRRTAALHAAHPQSTIITYNNPAGSPTGYAALSAYIPDDPVAAAASLADSERFAANWPKWSPIVSGWPQGIPTSALSDAAFRTVKDWAMRVGQATGLILLWNQADDQRQADMCGAFNARWVA